LNIDKNKIRISVLKLIDLSDSLKNCLDNKEDGMKEYSLTGLFNYDEYYKECDVIKEELINFLNEFSDEELLLILKMAKSEYIKENTDMFSDNSKVDREETINQILIQNSMNENLKTVLKIF